MPRQFQVSCDDCPFEQEAPSREAAEDSARRHRDQTGHDIVAVELPQKR